MLEKSVVEFIRSRLSGVEKNYLWDFDLVDFPDAQYQLVGASDYERTKNLRRHISRMISTNHKDSRSAQIWYVKAWGKVRGNKEETLEKYISAGDSELIALSDKGIATWSKILSVRDPSRYAIYDARVALSLNSIQYLEKVDNPRLFPQLVSRNSSFVVPSQTKIRESKFFPLRLEGFYKTYLRILEEAVLGENGKDVQDAEMVLFGAAEELSSIWRD